MHVEMEHGLAGGFPIVLYQIQSVALQSLLQCGGCFFRHNDRFLRQFIRKLIQIGRVCLRKQKRS